MSTLDHEPLATEKRGNAIKPIAELSCRVRPKFGPVHAFAHAAVERGQQVGRGASPALRMSGTNPESLIVLATASASRMICSRRGGSHDTR